MKIFETHAHYDDKAFEKDAKRIIPELYEQGIHYVVNMGASIETSKNTIELTEKYPFIYGALGVHPDETKELNEENFQWLRESLSLPKIVAVGEIGLDYYWDNTPRDTQKYWFDRQMDLAREFKLPMAIHSREAGKDTLDMITAAKGGDIGGVIHCYSNGVDIASKYLNMGLYLGVGGVVTFSNSKQLKEVVTYAPLEQLVLETDSPYMAPDPFRGKRNTSLNLVYVAQAIAELKGISYEKVVETTYENGKKLYRIKP